MNFKCRQLVLWGITALLMHHTAFSQVPVRMEPRHKMVLENSYLRLLNVHIAPGDTSLYHIHNTPSVVIIISRAWVGAQVMGKTVSPPGETTPGTTAYMDYGNHPLIHRVYNQGPDTFHVMDIELLRPEPADSAWPEFPSQSLTLNWQHPLVRSFHLSLKAGDTCILPGSACPHLVVMIHGAVQAGTTLIEQGDYKWLPPGKPVSLTASNAADGVILELK